MSLLMNATFPSRACGAKERSDRWSGCAGTAGTQTPATAPLKTETAS